LTSGGKQTTENKKELAPRPQTAYPPPSFPQRENLKPAELRFLFQMPFLAASRFLNCGPARKLRIHPKFSPEGKLEAGGTSFSLSDTVLCRRPFTT